MATLAGGASDFFQAVAGYKAPSVRCLQLQVLGSTVFFFTQCGDSHLVGHGFSKGFPSTELG